MNFHFIVWGLAKVSGNAIEGVGKGTSWLRKGETIGFRGSTCSDQVHYRHDAASVYKTDLVPSL